jgi:hypothetical protein
MISARLKSSILATTLVGIMIFTALPQAYAGKATGCFYKGIYLAGKVKVVTSFPDLKIQLVKSFPDLKVQQVTSFPNSCGKWQFVNSFPNFKVQLVTSFPDIKVQFVKSFPGAT